ncbi:MAG: hypothetical protein ACLFVU_02920 [Phycisphaerae bacterium]
MPKISPKAIVEDSAVLADDVCVGPFCYIGPDVTLESGVIVETNVTIIGQTTIGKQTHVFPMAVIGATPEGADEPGSCLIGQANSIREHVTVYSGMQTPTRIGRNNLLMIETTVGPQATIGDHIVVANGSQIGQDAIIDEYVRMSGFTSIEPGVHVGAYTFTAGYVGVDRDAPPFAMIQGYPFRVRGVNTHNLRACGFGESDIKALKNAFRELFNGSGIQAKPEAMERLAGEDEMNPFVERLIESIAESQQTGGGSDA